MAPLRGLATAVIRWAVGSHRVPLALRHQDNNNPVGIVTWGPTSTSGIRSIRRFSLAELCSFPGWLTAIGFFYAVLAFSLTARRGERRLLESAFALESCTYMQGTGRLLPWIGRMSRTA